MAHLTHRFDEAVRYAHEVHGTQTKKGTSIPYLAHLMGVASIVLDDGGDEDEAIGALLHDAAEDHGGRAAPGRHPRALRRSGREDRGGLHRLVGHAAGAMGGAKDEIRSTCPTPAAPPSLRVSVADKVHNTYSILRDLRTIGEQVWERYEASPDDVLAYYQTLVRAYREAGGGRLVDELERIVRGIEREMGY